MMMQERRENLTEIIRFGYKAPESNTKKCNMPILLVKGNLTNETKR